jgi:hypothetical protein
VLLFESNEVAKYWEKMNSFCLFKVLIGVLRVIKVKSRVLGFILSILFQFESTGICLTLHITCSIICLHGFCTFFFLI